jgi:hypothetical protein
LSETLQAHAAGMEVNYYLSQISRGLTHDEVMQLHAADADFDDFAEAVEMGIPRLDALALLVRGFDGLVCNWDNDQESGISFADMVEALNAGADQTYYSGCRDLGISHADLMDVLSSGGSLRQYQQSLETGCHHVEAKTHAVNAYALGAPHLYSDLLEVGCTQEEMRMADSDPSVDLESYLIKRRSGLNHSKTMDDLSFYRPHL